MTIKQLAVFLGKSERTIDRSCKRLGFQVENGKKRIFSREEVGALAVDLFKSVPPAVQASIIDTFANVQGQPSPNAEVMANRQMMQEVASVAARAVLSEVVPVFERITDKYHQLVMQVLSGKKPRPAIAGTVKTGEIGSPRQAFEAAVRRLAETRGIGYDAAHMMVYRDLSRQQGRDFIWEADGQRIIDLLEREHLLTEGIRIAQEYIDMAVSA
jgi:hypothetical protein